LKAYEKVEEFIKILLNKGIQLCKNNKNNRNFWKFGNLIFYIANNMQKMGLFIENLQKNFCFLFVFCSVLLQEGKV